MRWLRAVWAALFCGWYASGGYTGTPAAVDSCVGCQGIRLHLDSGDVMVAECGQCGAYWFVADTWPPSTKANLIPGVRA